MEFLTSSAVEQKQIKQDTKRRRNISGGEGEACVLKSDSFDSKKKVEQRLVIKRQNTLYVIAL